MTTTAHVIESVEHTCIQGWDSLGGTGRRPYTELMVEFGVRDPGPAHVCGIHYTADMWQTRRTAYAECVRIDGGYQAGGIEWWAVHVNLDSHVSSIEYVVFCLDHRDVDTVRRIFDTNGGTLHRVQPSMSAAPARTVQTRYARASALEARPLLTGHGAAVRVRDTPAGGAAAQAPAAERITAAPQDISHESLVPYMEILMMRNFATNTWRFKANGRVSSPGCIIASPSEPGDPNTDQSYVNSWVRDSALCVLQAARANLPWDKSDMLDDYVAFSRVTQQNAKHQNRDGHACFHIDGQVRPWGIQSDGPALRTIAILSFYDKLSDGGRTEARTLINDDVAYLVGAYELPTTNLWEETDGYHFFTRAVQKNCFELVADRHAELGLAVDLASVQNAAQKLALQLEDHWYTERGQRYYRATVGGNGRGGNVDSSTLMGAVYGNLPASEPRLLATAATVWDSFRSLYNINHHDHSQGIGPMIGRYPEDTYDGDVAEQPNVGHPWPLCTALFAEYYYRVALRLAQDRRVTIDDLSGRFFQQTFEPAGTAPAPGTYPAGSPQFAAVQAALRSAGDRMLGAVVFHSDHLELSEQFDRDNGYEKSVRNLTWSYAAYVGAVNGRRGLAP